MKSRGRQSQRLAMIISLCFTCGATVKVLNSYEKFQTKRRVNFFTGFEKISQSFLSPYIM